MSHLFCLYAIYNSSPEKGVLYLYICPLVCRWKPLLLVQYHQDMRIIMWRTCWQIVDHFQRQWNTGFFGRITYSLKNTLATCLDAISFVRIDVASIVYFIFMMKMHLLPDLVLGSELENSVATNSRGPISVNNWNSLWWENLVHMRKHSSQLPTTV